MKPLMPPIGTSDNLFHDGNPATGVEGTVVTAAHLNNEQDSIRDTQNELIAILTAAALAPDSTAGQLLKALKVLFLLKTDATIALDDKQPKDNTLTALSGKDVVGLLQYLGLKTAAQRDVGTGTGQIPDMTAWGGSFSGNGWRRTPDGYIEQWGVSAQTATDVTITFPIPFPSGVTALLEHDLDISGGITVTVWQFTSLTNTGFLARNICTLTRGGTQQGVAVASGCRWFARGK